MNTYISHMNSYQKHKRIFPNPFVKKQHDQSVTLQIYGFVKTSSLIRRCFLMQSLQEIHQRTEQTSKRLPPNNEKIDLVYWLVVLSYYRDLEQQQDTKYKNFIISIKPTFDLTNEDDVVDQISSCRFKVLTNNSANQCLYSLSNKEPLDDFVSLCAEMQVSSHSINDLLLELRKENDVFGCINRATFISESFRYPLTIYDKNILSVDISIIDCEENLREGESVILRTNSKIKTMLN